MYKLSGLETLYLLDNMELMRIEKEILHLTNLKTLHCYNCTSLEYPPYAVCNQGIDAVRKYFTDLLAGEGVTVTEVPVSLLGDFEAGKSSIKESLKRGHRYLTRRENKSLIDEATKVFQIESLSLPNSTIKLIDHGGHEVYHLTYLFCLRERCTPIVVVNIEQFVQLSTTYGYKEAARQVCFNWLAHIYLVSPRLGSPILALTHTDKLTDASMVEMNRKELLDAVELIRSELLKEESQCSGQLQNSLSAILHLSNKDVPIFSTEDIFEFNNDLNITSNIEALKENINRRCSRLNIILPRLWEVVDKFIEDQTDKVYLTVSDLRTNFPDNLEVILRYLHNSGEIFWFENVPELSDYIFHRIPKITEMISVLFHHCSEEVWRKRLDSFTSFTHDDELISKRRFESLIEEFTDTGVLDEALLRHLVTEESEFPFEIALQLLKSFYILHGPVTHGTGTAYIVPYFAKDYMSDSWKANGLLQIRLDVIFGGLFLPKYVLQLMTVVVLNHTLGPNDVYKVAKNGASVEQNGNSTHFVHDYNNRKVTLQVSTSLELLEKSWRHLVEVYKSIKDLLSKVWTACHTEVVVYCAHCLFLRHPDPSCEPEPKWLRIISENKSAEEVKMWTTFNSENVSCRRCQNRSEHRKLTVPKPFRIPCELLTLCLILQLQLLLLLLFLLLFLFLLTLVLLLLLLLLLLLTLVLLLPLLLLLILLLLLLLLFLLTLVLLPLLLLLLLLLLLVLLVLLLLLLIIIYPLH